jgi:hypothetical protein
MNRATGKWKQIFGAGREAKPPQPVRHAVNNDISTQATWDPGEVAGQTGSIWHCFRTNANLIMFYSAAPKQEQELSPYFAACPSPTIQQQVQ